jgi:flagellar L-ring protein FlgH
VNRYEVFKNTRELLVLALLSLLLGGASVVSGSSLYEQASFTSMYSDQKAWKLGDNVTVYILESSTAQSKAGDTTNRKTKVDASIKSTNFSDKGVGVGISGDSDNSGATKREGNIQARLTVSVAEIDKSGRLFVKGSQDIVINDELQKITLSGWLRPKDISAQNTVLSSRLASSEINYEGYGDVSMNRKPGLIKRFFMAIGLF